MLVLVRESESHAWAMMGTRPLPRINFEVPQMPVCSRRTKSGSILIDALIGLSILSMGAVAYYGLMPVIARSHEIAQQESKAGQIAARLSEEYGMLKPSEINTSTLAGLHLIDTSQISQPWSFSHIPLDDGTDYSPAKVLRNGSGRITATPIAQNSILITIQVSWTSPTGVARSLTTGTVVGGYR